MNLLNNMKAIIFDAGGVYLNGSFVEFVNKGYAVLDVDKKFDTNEELVFDLNLNKGIVCCEECFRNFFKVPISEAQMEEIKKLWTSTWTLTEPMRCLIINLKKHYKLAILSNSDELNSNNYFSKGWYSYFNCLILSHEIGIIKPDKKIYKIVLGKLQLPAEECIFIDDQIEALRPAKHLGMKTILFKSIGQLKEELKNLSINID